MEDSSQWLKMIFMIMLLLRLQILGLASAHGRARDDAHPLSKINIHKTTLALRDSVSIKASPSLLGSKVPFHLHCWILLSKDYNTSYNAANNFSTCMYIFMHARVSYPKINWLTVHIYMHVDVLIYIYNISFTYLFLKVDMHNGPQK